MNETRTIPAPAATDRHSFTILIEGNEISEEYKVMSIVIKRTVNKIALASIFIQDGAPNQEDFPISNTDDFLPSKAIEIQAGYHQDEEIVFKGIITAQKVKALKNKPSILRIEAKTRSHKVEHWQKKQILL